MSCLDRRSILAVAATLIALAAAAPALATTLSLSPNVAGKASQTSIDISFDQNADNPSSVVTRVARGFRLDTRALPVKCSRAQADSNKCPSKSRIGGGTADLTVTSVFFPPTHLTATLDLFLAPPPQAGDLAGVVAHFKEPQSSQEGSIVGRVRPEASGQYGLDLIFDGFGTSFNPPQGVKVHVDRFQASFGGQHRTVRKRVKRHGKTRVRKVRYDLIKNPATCPGSWPYEVVVDQRPAMTGSVACSGG